MGLLVVRPQAKDLLGVLANYPAIKTLIGGVFTTMAPEMVITHPQVQCIGIGEGEEVVIEFCEAVRHGVEPTGIHGTLAKDAEGRVIHNPPRQLVDRNGRGIGSGVVHAAGARRK